MILLRFVLAVVEEKVVLEPQQQVKLELVETVEMVQIIHIVEATSVMLVAVVVEAVIMDLTVLEYMVVETVVRITQTSPKMEPQT